MVERYLTVEEYADRVRVTRKTVYEWVRTGVLREGTHYVKLTRKALRFPYPQCLEAPLHEAAERQERAERIAREAQTEAAGAPTRRGPRVNLDYGLT